MRRDVHDARLNCLSVTGSSIEDSNLRRWRCHPRAEPWATRPLASRVVPLPLTRILLWFAPGLCVDPRIGMSDCNGYDTFNNLITPRRGLKFPWSCSGMHVKCARCSCKTPHLSSAHQPTQAARQRTWWSSGTCAELPQSIITMTTRLGCRCQKPEYFALNTADLSNQWRVYLPCLTNQRATLMNGPPFPHQNHQNPQILDFV